MFSLDGEDEPILRCSNGLVKNHQLVIVNRDRHKPPIFGGLYDFMYRFGWCSSQFYQDSV